MHQLRRRGAAVRRPCTRKAGDKLRFFGIHYQAAAGTALRSARDFDMFFPSVHDADGAATIKALTAPAPPETWFVTADGRVAYRHRGVLTSQRQLDSYVATLPRSARVTGRSARLGNRPGGCGR